MAINSYANLKQAIERWSHRTDISDVIEDFIALAENQIDKKLMLRSNELRARATAPTADRFLSLPDRFLKMRRLTIINGSLNYEIQYKSAEEMVIKNDAGRPRFFTVSSQLEFDRTPDSAYTLEMQYFTRLNPLSDTNTTNNVLNDFPDLYLYGSLIHLHNWANDIELVAAYENLFDKAILEANKQERMGRYGAAPRIMTEGSTP